MADRYQNRAYPLDDGQGHQPAQQRPSGEGDPLAELARLIGQSDPFNNFGRDARPAPPRDTSFSQQQHVEEQDYSPEVQPPGPPSWMQRMRQNAATQEAHEDVADERSYHQSPPFAPAAEAQPDPSRYDDVLYGDKHQAYAQQPNFPQTHDPNFADDRYAYQGEAYPAEGDAEPEEKPRRGGLLTVAVVIALGVVGTAGAYAYRSFGSSSRGGEPPVIKADTGPTKIVPPTNQAADGSKLIYDRIGQGSAAPERVVSREEQPLDVNKTGARVVFPPLNQGGAAAAPAQAGGARVAAAPPAASAAQSEEPRRVRTLSIRPDQAEPAPTPAPAKQPPRAAAPPPAQVNANASANSPLSLSPQQAAPAPQRSVSTTPPGAAGTYVVQVSSQRSEADAQASYRALQSKYPTVLASRQASIRRADLGDKGVYYRAMVGPFGSSEDATRLCDSLKAAGGQCNIMRN